MCLLAHICWCPDTSIGSQSWLHSSFAHWVRVSQFNPDLHALDHLTNQLAPGNLPSPPCKPQLSLGRPQALGIYMGSWGPNACPHAYNSQHFTYWAISQAQGPTLKVYCHSAVRCTKEFKGKEIVTTFSTASFLMCCYYCFTCDLFLFCLFIWFLGDGNFCYIA